MCKQNDSFQHLQLTTFHNYGLVIGNRNWWSWRMEGTSVISDRGSVVTSRNVNVFTGPIRDQDLKIGTIFSCFIWLADRRLEAKRSQSNPQNELKNNWQWAKARHILNTTWITWIKSNLQSTPNTSYYAQKITKVCKFTTTQWRLDRTPSNSKLWGNPPSSPPSCPPKNLTHRIDTSNHPPWEKGTSSSKGALVRGFVSSQDMIQIPLIFSYFLGTNAIKYQQTTVKPCHFFLGLVSFHLINLPPTEPPSWRNVPQGFLTLLSTAARRFYRSEDPRSKEMGMDAFLFHVFLGWGRHHSSRFKICFRSILLIIIKSWKE